MIQRREKCEEKHRDEINAEYNYGREIVLGWLDFKIHVCELWEEMKSWARSTWQRLLNEMISMNRAA